MILAITISSLSLLSAIAIVIPIYHEASAKECDNDSHIGSNGDSSRNDASYGTNCSDKQDSNLNDDDEHSSDESSNLEKAQTPFILAEPIPFP
jgi:hypothetical protein